MKINPVLTVLDSMVAVFAMAASDAMAQRGGRVGGSGFTPDRSRNGHSACHRSRQDSKRDSPWSGHSTENAGLVQARRSSCSGDSTCSQPTESTSGATGQARHQPAANAASRATGSTSLWRPGSTT
jgi:hypothetical protein